MTDAKTRDYTLDELCTFAKAPSPWTRQVEQSIARIEKSWKRLHAVRDRMTDTTEDNQPERKALVFASGSLYLIPVSVLFRNMKPWEIIAREQLAVFEGCYGREATRRKIYDMGFLDYRVEFLGDVDPGEIALYSEWVEPVYGVLF